VPPDASINVPLWILKLLGLSNIEGKKIEQRLGDEE